MKNLVKKIFAFLYPKKCVSCGQADFFICPICRKNLPNPESNIEDWITAVWSYKDKHIRRLIKLLKFHGKFSVIEDIGETLYDHLEAEILERAVFENINNIVLVPIPITNKKFRKRGYNQSEIIAKELAKRASPNLLPVENILLKIKETDAQSSIRERSRRLSNLKGSFAVKRGAEIKHKTFILIDDITTTHATLKEARRALREAGAKKVLGFTIAH